MLFYAGGLMRAYAALCCVFLAVLLLAASALAAGELEGTSWKVLAVNYGRGEMEPPAKELSVCFGKNGQIYGSAGCSTYSTPYEVSGEKLKIHSIVTTLEYLPEVIKATMDDERTFLRALSGVSGFSADDTHLYLLNADGSMSMVLTSYIADTCSRVFVSGVKESFAAELFDNGVIIDYKGVRRLMYDDGTGEISFEKYEVRYRDVNDPKTSFVLKAGAPSLLTIDGKKRPGFTALSYYSSGDCISLRHNPAVFSNGRMHAALSFFDENNLLLSFEDETFLMKRAGSSPDEKDSGRAEGERYEAYNAPKVSCRLSGDKTTLALGADIVLTLLNKNMDSAGEPLLGSWLVESLRGKPLPSRAPLTMDFESNGRLTGVTALKKYFATWEAAENGAFLTGIIQAPVTIGSSEEDQTDYNFFNLLFEACAFEIRDGRLIIKNDSGESLIAKRNNARRAD